MINHPVPINFLRHVYSESTIDIANILVAEAEDNYNMIINYLHNLHIIIGKWIEELETEKEKKNRNEMDS